MRQNALLPQFIPAIEKHGHLSLNPALREQLLKVSASIDRLLKEAHTSSVKSVTGHLTASVKVSRSECSPSMSGILRDL